MTIKILRYIFLIIFAFLWFLGCSKSAADILFDADILKDDYRYGDLYRLSNLSEFKTQPQNCNTKITQTKLPVTLYLAGDSYTEKGKIGVNPEDFVASKYVRVKLAEPNHSLELVPGKKILVIETVERHFRERFTKPWLGWELKKGDEILEEKSLNVLELKMPYNEELHQTVLFGFDFWQNIKEVKANINRNLFKRIDDKVKLSPDESEIVYSLDVDPGISSSFDPISDSEIKNLVKNVNNTYIYYKNLGFDEVILSIIPNKTSIVAKDLGRYNNLVQRIEQNPELKMPLISLYDDYRINAKAVYLKGDTHWTCIGKKIWLDKVNEKLLNTK